MNDRDDEPDLVTPAVARFLTKTFLTREYWRHGNSFSMFEALICDQFDEPWVGVRAATTIQVAVDLATDVHDHVERWRRR